MKNICVYTMEVCRENGTLFFDEQLPKGAVYGIDKNGAFYCLNFKIKAMTKKGRPVLEIFRYYPARKKWLMGDEGNETTDIICDFYLAHDEECQVDIGFIKDMQAGKEKQYHIQMLKIAEEFNKKHNGYTMPKGAIYGVDEKGAFVCTNFRLQTQNGKKSGYINGMPCLVIIRPQRRATEYSNPFYEKQGTEYYWKKCVEHNNTTLAIMRMYDKYADKCVIAYPDDLHEVASKQTSGLDYTDPVHFTSIHGRNAMSPRKENVNSWCAIARPKSLEEMADFQRGRIKW